MNLCNMGNETISVNVLVMLPSLGRLAKGHHLPLQLPTILRLLQKNFNYKNDREVCPFWGLFG